MSLTNGNGKPGSNTVLTSVMGMVFHLAGFCAALAPLLAGQPRLMGYALLAAAAFNAIGGFLGNAGSIGALKAGRQAEVQVQSLAGATADHVEQTAGSVEAAKITESVK